LTEHRLYVSRAANRESIREHGLDWRLMTEGSRGIAGSDGPELEGVFLCESLEDAEFFVDMARGERVDVWEVDACGLAVEDGPDGWLVCRTQIPPDRLALRVADARSHDRPVWMRLRDRLARRTAERAAFFTEYVPYDRELIE
jgi:hypothetical protein